MSTIKIEHQLREVDDRGRSRLPVWTTQGLTVGSYSVKDFGAKGDGITDDTEAFQKAAIAVSTAAVVVPETNRRGRLKLIIPPGRYLITGQNSLLYPPVGRVKGFVLEGAGDGLTQIIYKPSSLGGSDVYLINNQDIGWMWVEIKGIEFINKTAGASFMLSTSNGGPQRINFKNCTWKDFKYGFRLQGTNVNSEFHWDHCNFTGDWTTCLWLETSDQFVNYTFVDTEWECNTGTYIKATNGGDISIYGGSIQNIVSGTMFSLEGNVHAYGSERFYCSGVRFEQRTNQVQVMFCEWTNGNVVFEGCDFSTHTFDVGSYVCSVFKRVGVNGPTVAFKDCRIMGKHEYQWDLGAYQTPMSRVYYDGCQFTQAATANDFLVLTPLVANINLGGGPVIHFHHCRGTDNASVFDTDFHWQLSSYAETTRRVVSIRNFQGDMPHVGSGAFTFKLPLNCVVTYVKLYCPAFGTSFSATGTLTLQTSEGSPTVLATAAPNPLKNGFNVDASPFFVCDADNKRTLQLIPSAGVDQTTKSFVCLVEYVG